MNSCKSSVAERALCLLLSQSTKVSATPARGVRDAKAVERLSVKDAEQVIKILYGLRSAVLLKAFSHFQKNRLLPARNLHLTHTKLLCGFYLRKPFEISQLNEHPVLFVKGVEDGKK